MSKNESGLQGLQNQLEISSADFAFSASTEASTPPTSVFDSEEKALLVNTKNGLIKGRLTETLNSIIDVVEDFDVRESHNSESVLDSVLESIYFELDSNQKERVYRFCYKVVDLHFDEELDRTSTKCEEPVLTTEGGQATDDITSELMEDAGVEASSLESQQRNTHAGPTDAKEPNKGSAQQKESISTIYKDDQATADDELELMRDAGSQSPSLESQRGSFQGDAADAGEFPWSETKASGSEYSRDPGSMRPLDALFVSQDASNIRMSHLAKANQRPEIRQSSVVDAAACATECTGEHKQTPKKPTDASKTDDTTTQITDGEMLNISKNSSKTTTTNASTGEETLCATSQSDKGQDTFIHALEVKSIGVFIQDAYNELEYFATDTADQKLSQSWQLWKHESSTYSDGSMLLEVLDHAYKKTRIATFHYAFTAMHAATWFNNRKSLLTDQGEVSKPSLKSSEILDMFTGPKPQERTEHSNWEEKRKRCSTHLTRGRKLLKLVQNFGQGILFTGVWQLAKCKEAGIDRLIDYLKQDAPKKLVLNVLDRQMEDLIQFGKTAPDQFYACLIKEASDQNIDLGIGLESKQGQPRDAVISEAVNSLICEIMDRTSSETLVLTGMRSKVTLDQDSIRPIDPDKSKRVGVPNGWIDSNVILACMHLSYHQPGVKVGWSIDIHQQNNKKTVYKPFNRALVELKKWRKETKEGVKLVAFFPLFQHNNHFSLLEIDDGDKCLYHYDSLPTTAQGDVMSACKDQFSEYNYVEPHVFQQEDGHSCGPWVIHTARQRMAGMSIQPGRYGDGFALRIREDVK
ncbi:hypothetical protein VFPPC_10610 [Pochonia chlamydosporia 170]|uniref:Ubiquitin-like protease family profile domain-containing protein n=1 Tax=Pochonia chlamydosporia 170 TaxID=1380566 RepID=A0A179F4Z0_METCM|nr:hypothetical protein VFPPC_10610 [Pochonia chlamydosporia 170]OAQ60179.1 hypothetical protein VFPPC_10610 [Pochonia chlamydosporia 170]